MAGPKSYWGERVLTIFGLQLTGVKRVTIKPKDEDTGSTVSMDGDNKIIWGRSWTEAEIEVELLQSSKSNDHLSALFTAFKKSYGTAGVLPFAMSDLNGSSLVTAGAAWIRNYPEQGFTETGDQTRVWTLETDTTAQINAGGI